MSTTRDDKQSNLKLHLLLKTQPYKLFYNIDICVWHFAGLNRISHVTPYLEQISNIFWRPKHERDIKQTSSA